jgi:hypothetical protein
MTSLSRRALLVATLPASVAHLDPTLAASDNVRARFIKAANADWQAKYERVLAEAKAAEKRGEFSSLAPPERLVPFKDWDYYYTDGHFAQWRPNPGQPFAPVRVPRGFVTDLTSIPQIFWSSGLRPEGAYAYAALIHDYLYWMQDRPREEADQIFLFAMEDSKVDKSLRTKMAKAIQLAGGTAWRKNEQLKERGERRLLREFPPDFTISWKEWSAKPGVFL